jgi:branched-chain amino acid transport system substrate-binding protein
MTSAELLGVKETIDTSNAILISQSSTSTELSLANDNIFRFVPDDTEMAKAISAAAWEQGISNLMLFYRDDSWGNGLAELVKSEFEAIGGSVICETNYYSFRTSVYQESLDEMTESIIPMLASNDTSSFGVQLSCFDEGTDILEVALNDQLLSKIKWFGSDGIAENNYLLEVEDAVGFARSVEFAAPIYGIETSADYTSLVERLTNQLGYPPNAYVILAYEALRAAALALVDMEEGEAVSVLKARLTTTLNGYEGVTGTIDLNEAGDRSDGTYFFWKLNDSGTPEWEIGYKFSGGSIIY